MSQQTCFPINYLFIYNFIFFWGGGGGGGGGVSLPSIFQVPKDDT